MNYQNYLNEVNRTWKKDENWVELAHCNFAIIEEIGEISGWYKKHYGYGKPKTEDWRLNILGEFGDLLYYLTKYAELTNCESIKVFYEKNFTIEAIVAPNIIVVDSLLKKMLEKSLILTTGKTKFTPGGKPYALLFDEIFYELMEVFYSLITIECFDFEEVQLSNIAKLKARHGNSFNTKTIDEVGRDRDAEMKALKKS